MLAHLCMCLAGVLDFDSGCCSQPSFMTFVWGHHRQHQNVNGFNGIVFMTFHREISRDQCHKQMEARKCWALKGESGANFDLFLNDLTCSRVFA